MERWPETIKPMMERGVGATAIYDRLRLDDPEFGGSLSAVKRMVAPDFDSCSEHEGTKRSNTGHLRDCRGMGV